MSAPGLTALSIIGLQNNPYVYSANSSEMLESEDEMLDAELRKSICSTIYATLCQVMEHKVSYKYKSTG